MPLSQEDLDILACPICHTPVRLVNDDTALKCDLCKRVYPIRDGFPCMIPDDATVVPD